MKKSPSKAASPGNKKKAATGKKTKLGKLPERLNEDSDFEPPDKDIDTPP